MKEIAIDQRLAYSTVRTVLSSAYAKLGISGSTELAVRGALFDAKREEEARARKTREPPRDKP